ncbi:sentrin-specific protease 1-like [Venturia canescens]|uniref:sentrin-specific protease 1-like n=1 Tax=Venturia canescens TaxID=32260 RepID=UPI001C9C8CAF|nr:sentrin-specific protease 1-like [Venturia canescens]
MDVATQTKCQVLRKYFFQQTGEKGGWDGTQVEEKTKEIERISAVKKEERTGYEEREKKNKIKIQNSDTQTERMKNKSAQVFVWRSVKIDMDETRRASRERTLDFIRRYRRVVNLATETRDETPATPTTEEERRNQQREEERKRKKQEQEEIEVIAEITGEKQIEGKTVRIGEQKKEMERAERKENEDEWRRWKAGEFVWGEETSCRDKRENQRPSISIQSLSTLQGDNWVNDEVINAYMTLISSQSQTYTKTKEKIHCMSSFFYHRLQTGGYPAVRRWTRKIDLFSFDKILVPLHFGDHWCLASIDLLKKRINFFDSLDGMDRNSLKVLLNYLIHEAKDKNNPSFNPSEWQLVSRKEIPRQRNGFDCGVFVCLFAKYEATNRKMNFIQEDIRKERIRIAEEITANKWRED